MTREEAYDLIRNSSPVLRLCERFDETDPLWNFSRHSHPYIELIYYIEGKGNLSVSDVHMSVSLFDTVVYPAKWPHQEDLVSERRREIICLWVDLPELRLQAPIQLHCHDGSLGNLFQLLFQEAKREVPDQQLLEYAMKLLLTQILRDSSAAKASEVLLQRILQYIHTYYAEKITLEMLAALEHISKSYLSRQFKQQTGMTVIAYLNNFRIETAKHLLLTTAKTVNEVSYLVGFESPKYFYRAFKAATGESPAGFRRQFKS